MDVIKKIIKFTKNLSTTGAIYETSQRGENEVIKYVCSKTPQNIVEFGAGLGNITRTIRVHFKTSFFGFRYKKSPISSSI